MDLATILRSFIKRLESKMENAERTDNAYHISGRYRQDADQLADFKHRLAKIEKGE